MIVRSIKKKTASTAAASRLAMTPMIDIVFQLLIFFILTFKVVPQEGDLYIAAAEEKGQAKPAEVEPAPIPLQLTLTANDKGELVGILLNKKKFDNLSKLQKHIIDYLGDKRGPESLQAKTTLQIAADPRLQHKHLIKAIDAVSGYKAEGKVVRLILKLSFKTFGDKTKEAKEAPPK